MEANRPVEGEPVKLREMAGKLDRRKEEEEEEKANGEKSGWSRAKQSMPTQKWRFCVLFLCVKVNYCKYRKNVQDYFCIILFFIFRKSELH